MKRINNILLAFAFLSALPSYSMEQQLLKPSSASIYQKICALASKNKVVTFVVGGVMLAGASYSIYRTWFGQPQEEKFITVQIDSSIYQVEVRPPSARVRDRMTQALTDYQLNPRDYKMYAFAKNYNICAFANSRDKRAVFNESMLQNDDSLTYGAYHESAHLKLDHSNSPKNLGTQEMEADTLACKTLLAKNNIRPICRQLLILKINERLQQYTNGQLGHNVSVEYKNIEQLLKTYNYLVATTHNPISPGEEEIITTITGNNLAATCNFVVKLA